MNNLDTSLWKWFKLEEVFSLYRGKRNKSLDRIKGNIEYYSASNKNNALTDKISNPFFIDKNKIIFTTFGDCFYVSNEFTASDEIMILEFKKTVLTKEIALFLISILKKLKWKYNFGRKAFSNKLKKEFIKLPINDNGEPDFQFMEDYIKNLAKKINYNKKINFKKTNLLNTVKYRQFNIQDLFKIRGSKKSFTQYEIKDGDYFYITTSNKNNGFSGTSDIFTEKGNIITFDSATEGKCFYQEKDFVGSDHVEILEPKNFTLNRYLGIYFITILNLELFRYSFGRKRAQKRMKLDTIYLPYTTDKKKIIPNFAFMENYIKSLAYSKYL